MPPADQFLALVILYGADVSELTRGVRFDAATADWTMAPAPSGQQGKAGRKHGRG